MKLSECYGVTRSATDDWFDPYLETDTRLFIDPFLIFEDTAPEWEGAHDQLISFFNLTLGLIAKSDFKKESAHWKAAERLLMFPEPAEFCLGHSEFTTRGAGASRGLRDDMMDGAVTAIKVGIQSVGHFEELTMFGPGVGVDRISDIVCNVLKSRFIHYTQDVAERHGLPIIPVGVKHASWSENFLRWKNEKAELPANPFEGGGVLLTPDRFLREIPVLEPSDFWNWSWDNHNEDLRGQFNYEVGRKVNAQSIIKLARRHPEYIKEYVEEKEREGADPYDFQSDPGFVRANDHGVQLARDLPLEKTPKDPSEFFSFVKDVVGRFVHGVEESDSWRLLWNDNGTPRKERAIQALFRAMVREHCRANDIDLTGEADAGRGPVDFKFSAGWNARALIEIKRTNNTRHWHGLTAQTPQYMKSEEVTCGLFVTVGFRDGDFEPEKKDLVKQAARSVSKREKIQLETVFVDAREKPSASHK